MMKCFTTVALAGAMAFSTGGCGVLTALKVDPATITAAQQASVATCGFLPTVETITNIIAAGTLTVPDLVANAICAAVVANQAPAGTMVAPGGRYGAPATPPRAMPPGAKVGTVPIAGVFVR